MLRSGDYIHNETEEEVGRDLSHHECWASQLHAREGLHKSVCADGVRVQCPMCCMGLLDPTLMKKVLAPCHSDWCWNTQMGGAY